MKLLCIAYRSFGGNTLSTHDKQSGFILYSTLMSITISTIVLTLLLGIVFTELCGMQN